MNKTAMQYAKEACNTIMKKYTPEKLPPESLFTYHQGVFLSGMNRIYAKCKEEQYLNYMKDWVESTLDENGKIKERGWWVSLASLDFRQAGILMLPLYQYTCDEKYLRFLEYLAGTLIEYPTNSKGGFWHNAVNDEKGMYEMWLDGLYMVGPLCAVYGAFFNKPEYTDMAVKQIILMWENMRGEGSNFLRHGWDDTKRAPWADPETGLSANVWGRAMGWYVVATVDMLDDIPMNHPERKRIEQILRSALQAVVEVQDEADGRWYEVLDMPGKEGNWLENSCSCLFVYAITKAVQKGILDEKCMENAKKGYAGIIRSTSYSEEGELLVGDICIGTCIDEGTYEHYINREKCVNDLHGSGAFILMCSQVEF